MKIEQIPPGLIPIRTLPICDIDGCREQAAFMYCNSSTSPDDAYTWSLCEIHAAEYVRRKRENDHKH